MADIAAFEPLKSIDVYDLTNPADEDQFVAKCREFLTAQMTFDALLDKKSIPAQNGQVLFSVDGGNFVAKTLKPKDYTHFWQNYEKVDPQAMMRIRQKQDRITEDFRRRFFGEFYTPVEFAAKGLEYVGRELRAHGQEWWQTGEYRFWDMAAGTGNLEFALAQGPSDMVSYAQMRRYWNIFF